MLSGPHLMPITLRSEFITWSWKQKLVGVSKTGGISFKIMKKGKQIKLAKFLKNNNIFTYLLLFRILVNLLIFVQLIPPALLTPTNCCFHDQVIPPLPCVLSIK